jgi:hypothetical protein
MSNLAAVVALVLLATVHGWEHGWTIQDMLFVDYRR